MWNVYLLDDEEIILTGFRKLMDWESLGCRICGSSTSSSAALGEILALQPDLLVTDVRMPDMTGLELISKLKSCGFSGQCIIASGYDDFNHCRDALRLNALDYILKPIDFDEFSDKLRGLLARIDRTPPAQPEAAPGKEENAIALIKEYLDRHFIDEVSLDTLSRTYYLNPSYISRSFKARYNITISDYIVSLRVLKAKKLLAEGLKSIDYIATAVGFGDYRYFGRCFKRLTGLTPQQYRKQKSAPPRLS